MLSKLLKGFNSRLLSTRKLQAPKKYSESFSRARNLMDLYQLNVGYEGSIFVAPNATIVGDVFMGTDVAVWHGTVIRGDINRITLVSNISIGNNCVLHTAASSPTGLGAELILRGNNVIQNNCTLYSCTIEQDVYVGHNSVILEGAILQKGAIIAPNSVVPPGRVVKERQVWGGNPIKYVRRAMEQQNYVTLDYSQYVQEYAQKYSFSFLPFKNAYLYRHGPSEQIDRHSYMVEAEKYEKDAEYDASTGTFNKY